MWLITLAAPHTAAEAVLPSILPEPDPVQETDASSKNSESNRDTGSDVINHVFDRRIKTRATFGRSSSYSQTVHSEDNRCFSSNGDKRSSTSSASHITIEIASQPTTRIDGTAANNGDARWDVTSYTQCIRIGQLSLTQYGKKNNK